MYVQCTRERAHTKDTGHAQGRIVLLSYLHHYMNHLLPLLFQQTDVAALPRSFLWLVRVHLFRKNVAGSRAASTSGRQSSTVATTSAHCRRVYRRHSRQIGSHHIGGVCCMPVLPAHILLSSLLAEASWLWCITREHRWCGAPARLLRAWE